ncbi:fimbrial protein [Serratia fonticola]
MFMKRECLTALMLVMLQSPLVGAVLPATDVQVNHPSLPVDAGCRLSTGGGMIDYGNQSRWQLQAASTGGNALTPGKRTLTLSVICPYTQPLRLIMHGDRAANGALRYGDRGSTIVRLFDMQLDGQSVHIMNVTPAGLVNGTATDSYMLKPGETVAATLNGRLARGKVLTARLEIEPIMTNEEARVTMGTIKESLLTLELVN